MLGLPALLLDVAENQTAVAKELHRQQCAIHVGDRNSSVEAIATDLRRLLDSYELRRARSQNSRELVDGRGASRVVSMMFEMSGAKSPVDRDSTAGNDSLRLRGACNGDARLLWEWANDSDVRAASFSSAPISWEGHAAWFEERLNTDGSLILIAENDVGYPCGQIRFDSRTDGDWEIDVSLAKNMRRRGLAGVLIALGVREMLRRHPGVTIHALVKPENTASSKAFQKANFTTVGTEQKRGSTAIHFVYAAESD
jgi:RimJ/RimL family protein N-acetyltransferase